ncbi:MAG: bifunctional metallophosphatase/5'-nucleotidase [Clostridia bacterium]
MKKCRNVFCAAFACLCLFVSVCTPVYAEQAETTIRIVHTNDLHGYYTANGKGTIGFAALKTLIDEQEADLVLDAGDTFHGQAFATAEQGLGIAELMKEVGYDAVTPGNHDWSYGADRLKELETAGGFSILASNVVTDEGDGFFDTPYLVKNVKADDGTALRVGVAGVIDDGFYHSTLSKNVAGLRFEEEAAVATETARVLKEEENCDIVLLITHQADCEGFVAKISGIDAVIAGHEHLLIDKTYPDRDGRQVPVVEAGYYFYAAGVLELTVDPASKTVTAVKETAVTTEQTAHLTENETVKAKIAAIEERQRTALEREIGQSARAYPYSWEDIRTGEQAIGRIVTAAYLDVTGADVAMENAGGIRAGIPQGSITYADLISISPYGNILVTKKLTGRQILDIVEYSLEINRACDVIYSLQKQAAEKGEDPYQYSWPDNSGSALQFGGIKIQYDGSLPAGSRIVSALIGGRPVEPDKSYTVATNSYVAENEDYPGMAQAALLKEYGTCEEALRQYFVKNIFAAAADTANLSAVPSAEDVPPTTTPSVPGQETPGSTPQTGDGGVRMWIAVMLVSGSAILLLAVHRKSCADKNGRF